MKDFFIENSSSLNKGILGIIATGGAATVSALQQAEAWLRVGSLCVGISVGLVTIWSIIKKSKKD